MFGLAAGLYQKYWAPVQLNVLLIGDQGVGKSSLLERIKVTQFSKRPIVEAKPRSHRRLCPAPQKYAVQLDDDDDVLVKHDNDEIGNDRQQEKDGVKKEEEQPSSTRQSSMEDIPIEEGQEEEDVPTADQQQEKEEKQKEEVTKEFDLKPGAHMLSMNKIRPTIGMNLARVDICGAKCHFWDLGGKMQELWPKYYADADAIVFCIKSKDQVELLHSIRKELSPDIPVLVFGHLFEGEKQPEVELPRKEPLLELHVGSAKTGEGVRAAFEWLVSLAMRQQRVRQERQQK